MIQTLSLLFVAALAAPPPTITDQDADRIVRDSCQRCHDNARVAFVKSEPTVIAPIRRSARFNLQAANLIQSRAVRQRVADAIETGKMPFAEEFTVGREMIHRDRFLASDRGRALMEWLNQP